jgi:hypothetical protein
VPAPAANSSTRRRIARFLDMSLVSNKCIKQLF